MHRARKLGQSLATASLLIIGLCSTGAAEEKLHPAGTWVLRATPPGRPVQESILKLEKSGDKLVGMVTDSQGRTGSIKDAQFHGSDISFLVEAERQGQKISFIYKGKLTADAMKGKVTAKMFGRELHFDFDGKRAKENATVSGSWKLTLAFGGGRRNQGGGGGGSQENPPAARQRAGGGRGQGGGRPGMPQMMLNLKEEDGKVSGEFVGFGGKATPIQDVKLKDGELSFKVPQEMGPNKATITFVAKLAGDRMQGTAKLALPMGVRDLAFQAERLKTPTVSAAGTWKLRVARKDGPGVEPTLKLTQSGTSLKGTYIGEQGETAIENALVFGDEITFDVARERNGNKYRLHYQGKIKGDTVTGSVNYDFDGIVGFLDFQGERLASPTASSDKSH
jgi:hypothetical protein